MLNLLNISICTLSKKNRLVKQTYNRLKKKKQATTDFFGGIFY